MPAVAKSRISVRANPIYRRRASGFGIALTGSLGISSNYPRTHNAEQRFNCELNRKAQPPFPDRGARDAHGGRGGSGARFAAGLKHTCAVDRKCVTTMLGSHRGNLTKASEFA